MRRGRWGVCGDDAERSASSFALPVGRCRLASDGPVAIGRVLAGSGNQQVPLVVNQRIRNREHVRSDPAFFALVYPAVVREVLTHILTKGKYDPDSEDDDWCSRWIRFVRPLGMDPPPADEQDEDGRDEWITAAVRAFCARNPACDQYLGSLVQE